MVALRLNLDEHEPREPRVVIDQDLLRQRIVEALAAQVVAEVRADTLRREDDHDPR